MSAERLKAFSDGVLAIIITIMVLELKTPHGDDLSALSMVWPTFLAYVLSFIYIGIYWSNHHHLFACVERVNGAVLWANINLLFWLSLLPFATGWLSASHFAAVPVATYGCALLAPALSWPVLVKAMIRVEGPDSILARAIGRDLKGKLSILLYVGGIVSGYWAPWIGLAFYAGVAMMWVIPDTRIEAELAKN